MQGKTTRQTPHAPNQHAAPSQMEDGKKQLNAAALQLEDGMKQIADNEKKLDDSQVQISAGQEQLDDAQAQLKDGYAQAEAAGLTCRHDGAAQRPADAADRVAECPQSAARYPC